MQTGYRRVYDSRHLQADCQEPGSAAEPCAQQSNMGYLLCLRYHSTILDGLSASGRSREGGMREIHPPSWACSYFCRDNYCPRSHYTVAFLPLNCPPSRRLLWTDIYPTDIISQWRLRLNPSSHPIPGRQCLFPAFLGSSKKNSDGNCQIVCCKFFFRPGQ